MTLQEYIREHGDEECAKRWGVKPRTTLSWRLCQRLPRIDQAKAIIKETGWDLDWEDIYGEVG